MARRSTLLLALLVAIGIACPMSVFAQDGDPGAMSSEETTLHVSDDEYWGRLAKDYPRFVVDPTDLNVAAANELSTLGSWGPEINWPNTPVSAANLPDGRILTYSSNQPESWPANVEYTVATAWDPETGVFSMMPNTEHDMFCADLVMLEDGRVFVTGGRNHVNTTSTFDFATGTWSTIQPMNRGRWYPTTIALPNGEVMSAIGSSGGNVPEVWNEDSGWRFLTGANLQAPILDYTSHFERNWWPYLHVAPSGEVLHSGPTPQMHLLNTTGNGSIQQVGPLIGDWYPKHGANIMIDEGLVITAGGAIAGDNGVSTNRVMLVDIRSGSPVVTEMPSMQYARKFHNGVMLPTGDLLVIGGNTSGIKFSDSGTVLAAELFDAETQTWSTLSDMSVPRNYHSVALLMPDGRVFSGGGGFCSGGCDNVTHTDGQIFSPPYLFNPDGSPATRPTILQAPSAIKNGGSFSVQATPGVASFSAVKMSATTHQMNTDLRFLNLPFTEVGSGQYDVQSHANRNVFTPGYWMVFAVDAQGVPSEAAIVQVSTELDPNVTHPGNQLGFIGQLVSLQIQASSPISSTLTFAATGLPDGLTIDPSTGLISGTPTTVLSNSVILTVTDSDGASVEESFSWEVVDPAGKVLREWWTGLPAGQELSLLTGSPDFPDNPTGSALDGSFEAPSDWNDNYGTRMRAYVEAPVTGDYRFWIASDDNGSLQLSTDTDPANALEIASVPNWSAPQEWDKYPAQQSVLISLTAGNSYYIEALMKEGGGGDNLAVAWRVPGGDREVIPAASLTAFNPNFIPPPPDPIVINPLISSPKPEDTSVAYLADASGGLNLRYKWFFGDATPETQYSSSPSIDHVFADPGRYVVTLTVASDGGLEEESIQFVQAVYGAMTADAPASSSSIVFESVETGNDRVWNVNPDNNSVSVVDAMSLSKLNEIAVGSGPRSLAIAPSGNLWVTNKFDATISVVDPTSMSVAATINLPRASHPFGIVFAPDGSTAFVVLEGSGLLLRVDPVTRSVTDSLPIGPNPRHLSVLHDASKVFVSRFITPPLPGEDSELVQTTVSGDPVGGEIVVVDVATWAIDNTVVLRHSEIQDAEHSGRGIPNYLGPMVISLDGTHGWVPSKQDNIKRGALRDGQELTHDSSVRSITSIVDLATETELYGLRIDHDDASVPSNAAFGAFGSYLFVALEGSRHVAVVEPTGGQEIARFSVGRAPQGLVVSPDGNSLFVHNFMDRSVGVYDISDIVVAGGTAVNEVSTIGVVATERLVQQVMVGKQFFYDAADQRLALQSYVSCASCHNDGGGDGRVWDFTGFGEGLRNTINLRGHAGTDQGPLHWSANFDEVQDFEGQIRNFAGGSGLMSDGHFGEGTRSEPLGDTKAGLSADLDALAAYVASLNDFDESPYRASDGSLTPGGVAGKSVFDLASCAACHGGNGFTDSPSSVLHDIGTLKPTSGNRLFGSLPGIDTPTLRGVWRTAPYLHDGSAATLTDAVNAHSSVTLSPSEVSQLVDYLRQIDDDEPAPAPVNTDPTNVALNATASQSSTAYGGTPDRAVDGNTNGVFYASNSVTHTSHDQNAWWEVDLGGLYDIASIEVYNRTDCCVTRISDFHVFVSSLPFDSQEFAVTLAQPGVGDYHFPGDALPVTFVDVGRTGRFVRVQLSGKNFMNLAEVEVMATPFAGGNQAPLIATIEDQEDFQGATIAMNVDALDPDGDELSFAATGLPVGLDIDPDTGLISGTVDAAADGPHAVTITVGDGSTTVSTDFVWTIIDGSVVAVNVAPNGTASQSSTAYGGVASRAIDGNTDGIFYGGNSVTHTNHDQNAWWELDLGGLFNIQDINIFNRADCCQTRLDNFHVLVSSLPFDSQLLGDTQAQPGVNDYPVGTAQATNTVAIARLGRYVRVQLAAKNFLNLAEVEVIATTFSGGNQPPVLATISDQLDFQFEQVSVQLTAQDPDGDDLTFSAEGLPAGLSVGDTSGLISGVIADGTAGDHLVSVTVSDGTDSAGQDFTWSVVDGSLTPTNVALGATVSQSSTWYEAEPERAIDGVTNGIMFSTHSVTHTGPDVNAWWEADLGDTFDIEEITIYPRTDCCQNRLTDFHVFVSASPFPSTVLNDVLGAPGVTDLHVTTAVTSPLVLSNSQLGRYVRVQMSGDTWNFLSLAELEVSATTASMAARAAKEGDLLSLTTIELPDELELTSVYPNPFGAEARIQYGLPEDAHVRLSVYDTMGRLVTRLVDGTQSAGHKTVRWGSEGSERLAAGIYFVILESDGKRLSRSIVKM